MKLTNIAMTICCAALLGACATPPSPLEFHPEVITQSKIKMDAELRSISVKTAPTGEVNWYRVENTIGDQFAQTSTGTGIPVTRQWEVALSDALNQSLIFRDHATRTVSLIVEIQKIEMSGIATVDYDVTANYRLMDRNTGENAYAKTLESRGSAETGEAFVGAVRARLAFVRAVQANIEQFLADLEATLLP